MRKFFTAVLFLLGASLGCAGEYTPQNGDIIFQTSKSRQSVAIQKATHSRLSHVGIVFVSKKGVFVCEAGDPVGFTPLDAWIARGEGRRYVVKRLVNAKERLTPEALGAMEKVGKSFAGKRYDPYFEWSDHRIYCSELVWKIYKRALGIELGRLQKMREFDLSHPEVQKKVCERFGSSFPADETVISPAAIYSSEHLITVHKG